MGVCVGMAAGVSNINIEESQRKLFAELIVFTAIPLRVIAAAYIGRWIGTCSRRYVLVIVIGAIALGSIAGFLVSLLMLSEEVSRHC